MAQFRGMYAVLIRALRSETRGSRDYLRHQITAVSGPDILTTVRLAQVNPSTGRWLGHAIGSSARQPNVRPQTLAICPFAVRE